MIMEFSCRSKKIGRPVGRPTVLLNCVKLSVNAAPGVHAEVKVIQDAMREAHACRAARGRADIHAGSLA
jgi:hypothetical protein